MHPRQELALLDAIIAGLPQLSSQAVGPLWPVVKNADTNLSGYQLFQLGNFIRGGQLQLEPLATLRKEVH
ncbi:protein of unknown function [Candidatus Hydrogenisulfobacillus filiaventi]|uniref:Uncharacterized protein n=1 Tax=Candidatus Hydrogenisulfobacillus filiaventi TaxID=2707344 RepID=A0A6F8ZGB9_9FIRM|nr:protein of unknown function [Candidatus Hydrogenisulfobacillus filiaventi]